MSHLYGSSAPQILVTTADTGMLEIVAVGIDASTSTVQLQGELDLNSAELVVSALDNQLACGRFYVRLDLSRLSFIDCAGLRVLVHAHHQFRRAGGILVLTGLGTRTARLLSITELDGVLLVADGHDPPPPRVRHLTSTIEPVAGPGNPRTRSIRSR